MYENELQHYGVLGMKWGIRRARKKGKTYTYKSHGQKKYEKKYESQKKKNVDSHTLNATKKKLDMFKKRDANRQTYAESASTGRQVVKTLLLGAVGNGTYSRLRSAGQGRVVSGGAAFLTRGVPILSVPISKFMENERARTGKKLGLSD